MKVSLNTVRQYIDFELPSIDALVHRINSQLGAIEEIIDLSERYKGIVVVRVVECTPLEGSDHLNVTKVDDGGVIEGIERDENGLVQVVCGAPNVRADMYAVWLAPGVTVPESYETAEPFVLSAKPLRGVVSNGMLASPRELAFGDSHDGILEIHPDEWKPKDIQITVGTDFAKAYGLDDTIIDIENKMFTHRPDCFGQLGVAREIAGISQQRFVSPEWYKSIQEFGSGDGLELTIDNDVTEKAPRFMAVAVKDVTVKESPVWLQAELVRLGSKPINNIVDVTNYVMLLTAQPMHAYDYDKVASKKLGVRLAHDGETLTLLGGKEIALHEADVVITDGRDPIALGGIMGGQATEVSSETKNIILECANFDMYALRRSSMRHGIFTDASTRFTKGQSPLQNPAVLQLALQSLVDVAGGEQASDVVDIIAPVVDGCIGTDLMHVASSVGLTSQFINQHLGSALSDEQIKTLLENVEIRVSIDGNGLNIYPPFWRTDIEIVEDIVEEVGRLYGFDQLPQILPQRSIRPIIINPATTLKHQLRDGMARAGANEVMTYSFVHKNLLDKAGQNSDDAFQLSNALSPDLHYYRRTVLPSLLDKMYGNMRAGYTKFGLFEIGKGHKKSAGNNDEGLPVEQEYVAFVLSDGGFYQAKSILEFLAAELGVTFECVPIEQGKLFEPKRAALIQVNNETIGAVGEYRSVIRRNFKLSDDAAGCEIDFQKLLDVSGNRKATYRPLGRFPSVERDVTFQVPLDTSYGSLSQAIADTLASTDLDTEFEVKGIYQPESGDTKNITFHISMSSDAKTLQGDDAAQVIQSLTDELSSKLGASAV